MRPMWTVAALAMAAIVGGCVQLSGTGTGSPAAGRDVIGQEPVTYSGEIPCADCPGQRVTVTLFTDRTFRLRRTYIGAKDGRDDTVYELGRWARAQDDGANRLRLASGTNVQEYLIRGPDTLRMLDREGHEIESRLNYDLKRLPRPDLIEGPMRLRGMYAYLADAATFNECYTGKRYPVLIDKDHLALERAYLGARAEPGAAVLAVFEGRFVERTPEPGAAPRDHVLVARFEQLRPGETCAPQAMAQASILNTYWRPVELEGRPVVIRPGAREPHLVLVQEGTRVRGFTGCNHLAGGFERGAGGFRFTQLVTTRMACLPDNDLETPFLAALNATASQRIVGDSLELRDADGKVRMRLEARYLY